jgi:hypothetical protein
MRENANMYSIQNFGGIVFQAGVGTRWPIHTQLSRDGHPPWLKAHEYGQRLGGYFDAQGGIHWAKWVPTEQRDARGASHLPLREDDLDGVGGVSAGDSVR